MAKIDLTISRKLEKQCRDWCKRWFPREAYGLLLGTILGDAVHVDEVWLPSESDALECFRKDRIFFKGDWIQDVRDVAEEEGLILVGDFHSHPYLSHETRMDPVQSETDLDFAGRHAIFGIVNVEQSVDGRLRSYLRWWGPSVKVRVRRMP